MEKLKKIAQIDAITEFDKNRVMKTIENAGFYIVDDPEYKTIFYLVEKVTTQ